MRLIDADELRRDGWVLHKMVGTTLHEMPLNHPDIHIVDAEPVRHGRWIKEERFPYYACSVCCQMFSDVGYGYDYCPYCGAKMDEEEET